MIRFDRGIRKLLEEAFEAGYKFSHDDDNDAPDFETWLKMKSSPEMSKDIRGERKNLRNKKFGWW